MLKKLIKYDFKELFKYWWIAAIASVGLGILAGGCIPIVRTQRDLPQAVIVSAWIIIVLAIMGIGIFAAFSTVMIFIRFYKNLFTDEGYLTFTLPVKRSDILKSKVISGVGYTLITFIVNVIDVAVMLLIGFSDKILTKEFFEKLKLIIDEIFEQLGAYTFVYILEAVLFFVACITASMLFLYICITFGSIITKKGKVVTSIGIYYVANSIFAFIMQLFLIFGGTAIVSQMENMTPDIIKPLLALIFICAVVFMLMISGIMYILQYYMLDRKLNLT